MLTSFIIKATNDLENFDKERHEEFKKYEMLKEHDRQEHLKTLDEEERKKEEEHYDEMKKKHADHPKVNHPVRATQINCVQKSNGSVGCRTVNPQLVARLLTSDVDLCRSLQIFANVLT